LNLKGIINYDWPISYDLRLITTILNRGLFKLTFQNLSEESITQNM